MNNFKDWEQFEIIANHAIQIVCPTEFDLICIGRECKLIDRHTPDSLRQFDILLNRKTTLGNLKVAVECKNWNHAVSISDIEAFIQKCKSCGVDEMVYVTKKGFQDGAVKKASYHNVRLITLQKITKEDIPEFYKDCILKINIKLHILTPIYEPNLELKFLNESKLSDDDIRALSLDLSLAEVITQNDETLKLADVIPIKISQNITPKQLSLLKITDKQNNITKYEKNIPCKALRYCGVEFDLKEIQFTLKQENRYNISDINIDAEPEILNASYYIFNLISKTTKTLIDINSGKIIK